VVAAEGHVGDEQSALGAATHGSRVMEHLVEGYRQSGVIAEDDHGDRIADEDDVHAGFVEQARGRIVIRGQANDFFEIFRGICGGCFALQKLGHGYSAVARVGDNTHDGLRYRSLKSGYSPVPNR
jgi:hypothetical protein